MNQINICTEADAYLQDNESRKSLESYIKSLKPHPNNRFKVWLRGGYPEHGIGSRPAPLYVCALFETFESNMILKHDFMFEVFSEIPTKLDAFKVMVENEFSISLAQLK